jgi:hypothetical protein
MRNEVGATPPRAFRKSRNINGMTNIRAVSTDGNGCRRPDVIPAPADRLFRDRVRRVHALGPRPVGEVLAEIMGRYPDTRPFVEERLDRFADLDPALVAHLGGRDWLEPAAVIRLVMGGRA